MNIGIDTSINEFCFNNTIKDCIVYINNKYSKIRLIICAIILLSNMYC